MVYYGLAVIWLFVWFDVGFTCGLWFTVVFCISCVTRFMFGVLCLVSLCLAGLIVCVWLIGLMFLWVVWLMFGLIVLFIIKLIKLIKLLFDCGVMIMCTVGCLFTLLIWFGSCDVYSCVFLSCC